MFPTKKKMDGFVQINSWKWNFRPFILTEKMEEWIAEIFDKIQHEDINPLVCSYCQPGLLSSIWVFGRFWAHFWLHWWQNTRLSSLFNSAAKNKAKDALSKKEEKKKRSGESHYVAIFWVIYWYGLSHKNQN